MDYNHRFGVMDKYSISYRILNIYRKCTLVFAHQYKFRTKLNEIINKPNINTIGLARIMESSQFMK
jgi:hypothetical protein